MNAPLDITGERYGRLVAIRRAPDRGRRTIWLFKCDCGNETLRNLDNVRAGTSRSCGCLQAETTRARSLIHGHTVGRTASRTHKAYSHAKARCLDPGDEKFPQYGGRGITMCERWRGDFREFLADMGECPPGLTLDRVDVNGNYEPANCRWTSKRIQARNRTDNVFVMHNGERMVLKDFATAMRVSYKSLHQRVRYRGQDPHEAAAALPNVA